MAGFRKAKGEQAAIKMALYGAPGSGKTFTSLLFSEGLARATEKRVAFVDTERGTDFYCKAVKTRQVHPEAFDFDALYSRSMTEVLAAVQGLKPEEYGVIVIDSITHLWEAARAAYSGKVGPDGQIPFHAWGKIKKPYKELMTFLLNCPMHVFILGREGNEFQENDDGELKCVGKKMKAEGETPYEPHILLRMEALRQGAGKPQVISAFAEKDRTGVLAGKVIAEPNFENVIKPILGLLGDTQAKMETPEETAAKDAEAIENEDAERATYSAEQLRKFKAGMDLAETVADLDKLSKSVTKEVKARMLATDVSALREHYNERAAQLKAGKAVA